MNYHISEYILKSEACSHLSESELNEIMSVAKKYLLNSKYYKPYMYNNEDLLNNLRVCIWRADETFDKNKGQSQEARRIEHCNWEIYRYIKKKFKNEHLDITIIDHNLYAVDDKDSKNRIDLDDIIETYLKKGIINDREAYIIFHVGVLGGTLKDVAIKIRRSKQRASQIYKAAVNKVRIEAAKGNKSRERNGGQTRG